MNYKNFYKKIIIGAAALLLILAPIAVNVEKATPTILSFNAAHAQAAPTPTTQNNKQPDSPNLLSCVSGSIATCSVYFIAFVANSFIAVAIAIGAFLVQFGLQLNDNIFNSPAVLTGFSVALALANLGFVLGIIIIALATILRNQTYGLKQLLWKLIVMAVFVNFGLVVTAPIVGLADSMSNYFINASSPAGLGYTGYVTTITQAFSPQSITINGGAGSATNSTGASVCGAILGPLSPGLSGICQIVGRQVLGPSDILMQQINAMFFGIVFSSLTAFTFLCLAVLLLVRYLMLSGLLIVLPLAWLTFVFPKFDNSFGKWWNTFIKWVMFPPLALFFIYLALITASTVSGVNNGASYSTNYAATISAIPSDGKSGPAGTLATQTGLAGPIQQAADEVLLVGLTIMGLMFANSLSGKAGSTVVNSASHGAKVAAGYVGKKGKRIAGDRLRTMGRKTDEKGNSTTSIQRLGSRLQSVPVPGFKAFGSKIASTSAPAAFHEEKKGEIKKYIEGNLKSLDNKGLIARANATTALVNPVEAASIAQELAKRDLIASPDLKTGRTKDFLEISEKMGNVQSILNNRPELAAQTSAATPKKITDPVTGANRLETDIEAMSRAISEVTKKIKVADITDINHKSMGDHTGARASFPYDPSNKQQLVALSMSPTQLRKLVTEGSTEQTRAFKDTIEKMMVAATAPGAAALPPDINRQLTKLHDYISGSPEWRGV